MQVLRLQLHPSRILAVLVILVHAAGAAGVLLALPNLLGAGLAFGLLALGGAAAWDRALLRSRRSVRVLEIADGSAAALELASGARVALKVLARRNIGPWWVTLPARGGPHRVLLVVRDMLSPAEFRLLRLWALWGRLPAAGPSLPA